MQGKSIKEMCLCTQVECTGIVQEVGGSSARRIRTIERLVDRDALDVKDQVRVGGNVRGSALLAVGHGGGDGEATLTTRRHTSDTNVPALDDLADTELEGERLALLVGCVEISPVQKG